jgi:hypothetical protein
MARGGAIDLGGARLSDGQNPHRLLGSMQRTCSVILRHHCCLGLVSPLALFCRVGGSMLPSDSKLAWSLGSWCLTLHVCCVLEVRVGDLRKEASLRPHSGPMQCPRMIPVREAVSLTGASSNTNTSRALVLSLDPAAYDSSIARTTDELRERNYLHELYDSCDFDNI